MNEVYSMTDEGRVFNDWTKKGIQLLMKEGWDYELSTRKKLSV